MALTDLKSFIEDRLLALDPSTDIDPGSPAQVQFIEPILTRLGTDPIETDIASFITDRFAQEFPDIYALDPSVVSDTFVNPLRILLEPFKREIETIKRNQSLKDASVLSDEDAEALAANVFEERDSGGFAVGVARSFFSNPTNVNAEITTRFYTGSGLNFFPTNPVSITAEEMVFNRQGSLYFFDVAVKAEKEGTEYNIDDDVISGVDGIYGAVKVTNPREFAKGASRLDTPTFVATARESLTERSLVTRRGANARLRQVFQTDLRAIQVIGARDPEMQRDILVAASPGHAWITGTVNLYENVAFVQAVTIDGDESDTPAQGDTLYVYLNKYDFSGLDQASRFVRLTVEEVLAGPLATSTDPFQLSYFIRWSGAFPTGVVVSYPVTLSGGVSKKGTIRISSLPDVGPVSLSITDGDVHVYGHSDIYARPILQPLSKAVLSGLYDNKSLVERTTLSSNGGAGSEKNKVSDLGFDFPGVGILPGDVIILESSEDAGAYVIQKAVSGSLYLSSNLTKSRSSIRYRILRLITLDPFEPKIRKFPFGSLLANDLQTTIGSTLLTLSTNDLLAYSAKEGDTIRVLSGNDQRDYTIVGFDSVLGGRGIVVDRAAGSTDGSLRYELFTAIEVVEKPLVRVKEIMLLDSAKQTTGITIPPADPVALVPLSDFSSGRVQGTSQRASGYVLPSLVSSSLFTAFSGGNTASPSIGGAVTTSDRRYSLGFDAPTGTYKSFFTNDGGAFDYFELDLRADAQEACNYFVAISEFNEETENFPPVDPRPGDCLRIKTGPNKGSYLIKQVIKQKYKLYSPNRTSWVYFIQIYGSFPVDVFRHLIEFLNETGGAAAVTELPITTAVEFPTFFENLYNSFGTKLNSAFTISGATSPGAPTLQTVVESLTQVEYEWGNPARGVIRSYFTEPVLFEQNTGNSLTPTTYEFTTDNGDVIQFRSDPQRYVKHELIPSRLSDDSDPVAYPRDLDSSAGGGEVSFTDTENSSVFSSGIQAGDILAVHEEIFFHDNSKLKRSAVKTTAGSTQVTSIITAGNPFTSSMVGNIFFIEQGPDKGGYRVIKFIDGKNIVLDRPLAVSTPTIVAEGAVDSWGVASGDNKIVSDSAIDFADHINKFITIFGMNYEYQGSYKIKDDVLTTGTTAIIERTGDFPAVASEAAAYWVVTEAPEDAAEAELEGTVLYGLQAFRMYQNVPKELVISDVAYDDPTISTITVPTSPKDGFSQPYRIYRKDVRRITPSEMDENRDGQFVYFDTEVVSLDPNDSANIKKDGSYLTIKDGTYRADGYRHVPDDPTLTYSMKESGSIQFPARILPVGSEDSPSNFLNLYGAPVQVSYEKADVVRLLQEFLDSPEDRVTAANMLARHFLPSYVSYDATYVGGSAPSVIAKDVIAYLDTLPVETPVDISEIEEIIIRRGGNPKTPTRAMALIHDWDRKRWLEFSEDEVGGVDTSVPYNGTPRVSYVRPGPDVSGQTDIQSGERISLTRR